MILLYNIMYIIFHLLRYFICLLYYFIGNNMIQQLDAIQFIAFDNIYYNIIVPCLIGKLSHAIEYQIYNNYILLLCFNLFVASNNVNWFEPSNNYNWEQSLLKRINIIVDLLRVHLEESMGYARLDYEFKLHPEKGISINWNVKSKDPVIFTVIEYIIYHLSFIISSFISSFMRNYLVYLIMVIEKSYSFVYYYLCFIYNISYFIGASTITVSVRYHVGFYNYYSPFYLFGLYLLYDSLVCNISYLLYNFIDKFYLGNITVVSYPYYYNYSISWSIIKSELYYYYYHYMLYLYYYYLYLLFKLLLSYKLYNHISYIYHRSSSLFKYYYLSSIV
jgi:hypothetical protein